MQHIQIHTLGFPRIGAQRELKFALEKHWRGELTLAELEQVGQTLRARHWALQRQAGLDLVTVGDFAFYDQVANHIQLLGCEPSRFGFTGTEPELTRYFTLARGLAAETGEHAGKPALDMTKWFDTNYHYLVPELTEHTRFQLGSERLFTEVAEAQALGYPVKTVLIGPLTFLWLSKAKTPGLDRLRLLADLLPLYQHILQRLKQLGVVWVQLDEPILGLDLPETWRQAFAPAYQALSESRLPILLATYFSPLQENRDLLASLPVQGVHVDAVRAPDDLAPLVQALSAERVLSVGILDGRNIWKADLADRLTQLADSGALRRERLWLAPSCSLQHVPFSLEHETRMDAELKSWLAFAVEKLAELQTLKRALQQDPQAEAALLAAQTAIQSRQHSPRVYNPSVRQRVAALPEQADQRQSAFAQRQAKQKHRFALPPLPTTTIGSFPQTPHIRASRAAFRKGLLSSADYQHAMQKEIAEAVAIQEALQLDVLVHGEAERNDMVEYFGEQLAGFGFTEQGWVQSYGSRCVKPPVIYGDVTRPKPMTIDWTRYAQSLTNKPMKGMLTGPITLLQWSFVRDDQPRADTAEQIALAIRDEACDLEQAGIGIIQIDEPAIREGLPLRRAAQIPYLAWATRAFRLSAAGVGDETQIHTHMCYSEFNDILPEIAAMDADVITIETSRSDMELLQGFGEFQYPNEIGPGVYDIHSPQVPTQEAISRLLRKALAVFPAEHLWVNPDCGLKTRGWPETRAALANMVAAAQELREQLAHVS